jgi:hypothetical protein
MLYCSKVSPYDTLGMTQAPMGRLFHFGNHSKNIPTLLLIRCLPKEHTEFDAVASDQCADYAHESQSD